MSRRGRCRAAEHVLWAGETGNLIGAIQMSKELLQPHQTTIDIYSNSDNKIAAWSTFHPAAGLLSCCEGNTGKDECLLRMQIDLFDFEFPSRRVSVSWKSPKFCLRSSNICCQKCATGCCCQCKLQSPNN